MKSIWIIFLFVIVASTSCDDNEVNKKPEVADLLNGVYNRLAEVHDGDYFVALRLLSVNKYFNMLRLLNIVFSPRNLFF